MFFFQYMHLIISSICLAVVFIVDSISRSSQWKARTELIDLLSEGDLRDAPLLVLANKWVRLTALSPETVTFIRP